MTALQFANRPRITTIGAYTGDAAQRALAAVLAQYGKHTGMDPFRFIRRKQQPKQPGADSLPCGEG